MGRGKTEVRFGEQIRALFQAGPLGLAGDDRLLDQFQGGEAGRSASAFAALVERHGPMVLGVCRRALADPGLAEDAFQATFLILARRARTVRDRENLTPWLHRVARRVATRAKVRADRLKRRERPEPREVAVLDPDRVEGAEVRAIIDEEVDRLGDHQRLPVVLCCLEGLSHEEASARLAWPLGTVKSRLARGRRRLQERLVRRGVAPTLAVAWAWPGPAEAASSVPSGLVDATVRAILLGLGPATSGTVPAAVAALAREEIGSMMMFQLKAAGLLAAGASIALVGLALGSGPFRLAEAPSPPVAPAPTAGRPARPKAAEAVLLVLDPEGRPVADARVDVRDYGPVFKLQSGRTDADGRYTATGLPAGHATVVDIIAEAGKGGPTARVAAAHARLAGNLDRSLGATVKVPGVDEAGPGRGILEVRLGPLVILRGRVLDEGGNPVPRPKVILTRWVSFPKLDGRSSGTSVATLDSVPDDGAYTFNDLIPGATYSTEVEARGYTRGNSPRFKPEPGRATELPAHRLILADQEVGVVVVDPRGRPIAGVDVGFTRTARFMYLMAPKSKVWYQTTDASGRFRLTGLPRGPIQLTAFRRPEGNGPSVGAPKYADVPPEGGEVRIELPDPDDRPRAIE